MDISQASPLKVFLKNNLFSDVIINVYKINSPLEEEEKKLKMESMTDLLEDGECPSRKKRRLALILI